MKLVIDCNILISASLGSKVCGLVFHYALSDHQVYYCQAILDEIRKSLGKGYLQTQEIQRKGNYLLDYLSIYGTLIEPQILNFTLPDQADSIYMGTAMSAQADAIITGNQKHFPPLLCGPVRILSPRQFLTEIHPDLNL
ncbi:MAG: putative toxin-antitoxin system toxin component, PIN family [Magnetococcales bacterium]|nr:putative toxin-antitoxin system toxin component, PIN family [Magnetococcales bacterium]NGZ25363.1 putative toxin-antitoxin system toxin component, PIN family [Magnetococcales bacterium]